MISPQAGLTSLSCEAYGSVDSNEELRLDRRREVELRQVRSALAKWSRAKLRSHASGKLPIGVHLRSGGCGITVLSEQALVSEVANELERRKERQTFILAIAGIVTAFLGLT